MSDTGTGRPQKGRMMLWITLLAIAVVVLVFFTFQWLKLPGFGH